ncbi:hypothetical protein SteCoe_29430 [Stentor coeruleus]|uniref:Mitochondrial import inner membrane translocase subunit TIM50 n=1 Tax=Stentor coeruleus TaxID=5963 RepID=A0A1R2B628_9CILI|nr:hypothetical protein SteCoe_29430 [Stentor coeruleus]
MSILALCTTFITESQPEEIIGTERNYSIFKVFLKKLGKKLKNLTRFTSKLMYFEPCIPDHLQTFLSVDVLALMFYTNFPQIKSLGKMLKDHFTSISLFMERNNENSLVSLQCLTHTILQFIKEYIQSLIKLSLQPSQIFIILTSIELFRKIQKLPLSLIIEIVNRVHENLSLITDEKNLPKYYSFLTRNVAPFLPQYSHKEFTLVLDLDETLGHYHQKKFLKRPGVSEFLLEMDQYYELVLFTASRKEYADWAMDSVDPSGLVMLRLYREHMLEDDIKNLEYIGRDLDKTIIVDNFSKSFGKQPQNGIEIKSWTGDNDDNELFKLVKALRELPFIRNRKLRELISIINIKIKQ